MLSESLSIIFSAPPLSLSHSLRLLCAVIVSYTRLIVSFLLHISPLLSLCLFLTIPHHDSAPAAPVIDRPSDSSVFSQSAVYLYFSILFVVSPKQTYKLTIRTVRLAPRRIVHTNETCYSSMALCSLACSRLRHSLRVAEHWVATWSSAALIYCLACAERHEFVRGTRWTRFLGYGPRKRARKILAV